jgi:hypothetical protein
LLSGVLGYLLLRFARGDDGEKEAMIDRATA